MYYRRIQLAVVCLTGTLAYMPTADAHHPGGIGNPNAAGPINTISATTLPQGKVVFGLTLNHTEFDALSDDRLFAETQSGNEGVHSLESLRSYALFTSLGVTDDLMFTLRLPHQKRDGIREAEDHHGGIEVEDHGETSGIGDLALLAQYRFFQNPVSGTEAALLLGVKAPTGKTDEAVEDELQDAEFQPGSGSWDFSFGVAVTQRVGKYSFDANVLYTAITEGTQQTDLGDQILFNAAITYRLNQTLATEPMALGAHRHSHHEYHQSYLAIDLALEINGEWQDKEETGGVPDRNSGGMLVYLSPGARLSYEKWCGFISVGIPIITELNGVQSEPDWRISTGTTLSF